MVYYRLPNSTPNDPNLMFWAAWWLLRRGKTTFGRSDCADFAYWALKRGIVINPPAVVSELIEWCERDLVGMVAQRTEGPDPFLKS
jgi:hypothetical protein